MQSVRFRLNGADTEIDADPDRSLLDILRGDIVKWAEVVKKFDKPPQ